MSENSEPVTDIEELQAWAEWVKAHHPEWTTSEIMTAYLLKVQGEKTRELNAGHEYFLITNPTGDRTYVESLTQEGVEKRLSEQRLSLLSLKGVHNECDTEFWDGHSLLIKGHVVAPVLQAKDVK